MTATLLISDAAGTRRRPLQGRSLLIGRHAACDVVLDNPTVSRRHARLYCDPFDRWVIEDLGSRNGIRVGDHRVKSTPLTPGEPVYVGDYRLTLQDGGTEVDDRSGAGETTTLAYGRDHPVVLTHKAGREETLSTGRLKQLNRLIDRLAECTSTERAAEVACGLLTEAPATWATVLRIPAETGELDEPPRVLAFSGADPLGAPQAHSTDGHVSRRVLEAVRESRAAVMAGAARDDGQRMDLTVVDDVRPRAVLAAPISLPLADAEDTPPPPGPGEPPAVRRSALDVLYLEVPADDAEEGLLDFVQAAARQIGFARKAALLAEGRAERRALDRQLELAREIQANLTPAPQGRYGDLEVTVYYQPALWVGGDYCDAWTLPDGRLAVAVGDVCGKGLPAALVMMSLHAAMRSTVGLCATLGEATERINHHILHHTPDGLFITLVLAAIDPDSGRMEYINAGHPAPLLLAPGRPPRPLGEATHPPLGITEDDFLSAWHELDHGNGLVIVTDGVTEAGNPAEGMLGYEGLANALADDGAVTGGALVETIRQAVRRLAAEQAPHDDTTIFVLRRV